MMRRFGFYGLAFFCFTALSWFEAQASIHDPQGILEESDRFLGNQSFDEAFKLGDESLSVSRQCDGCSEQASIYKVEAITAEGAHVRTQLGENPPDQLFFSRTDFASIHGNFLRVVLGTFDHAEVEILSREYFTKTTLGGNQIEALRVHCRITFCEDGECSTQPIAVAMGASVPAVAQILEFATALPGLSKPVLELLEFTRRP